MSKDTEASVLDRRTTRAVQEVLKAIATVRYGSVEVVIHDSRVVQIVRTEKLRPDKEEVEGVGKPAPSGRGSRDLS